MSGFFSEPEVSDLTDYSDYDYEKSTKSLTKRKIVTEINANKKAKDDEESLRSASTDSIVPSVHSSGSVKTASTESTSSIVPSVHSSGTVATASTESTSSNPSISFDSTSKGGRTTRHRKKSRRGGKSRKNNKSKRRRHHK